MNLAGSQPDHRARRGTVWAVLMLSLLRGALIAETSPRKVTFSVWGSHSHFVLAGDEAHFLFTENGPDGIVLKSADLDTGSVSVVRKVPGIDHHIATIPGNPSRIAVAAQCCFVKSPSELWLLSLSGGDDIRLDTGEAGSNGEVIVSPSGRYVATGTRYGCGGGALDCMARSYAIFSTNTGKAEFEIAVGLNTYEQPEIPGESPAMLRRNPKVQRVGWSDDDVLTVQFDDGAKAFQRGRSGRWAATARIPAFRPAPVAETVYRKTVSLSTLNGVALDTVDVATHFGPEPGYVQLLCGRRRVVLFKVSPSKDGDKRYDSVLVYSFEATH